MRALLTILIFFVATNAFSQRVVTGTVLDKESKKPVPGASVFLNNTTIGTATNDEGKFSLTLPTGKYDVIVSSIGYETYKQTITAEDAIGNLDIRLAIKAEEMEGVVIEPWDKNGWKNWGKFFTDHLIGLSAAAKDCRILNPEVIRFRHNNKAGVLKATGIEPLVIENKALGYKLKYQLEQYTFNFRLGYLVYTGYPFFEEMEGSERQLKRWKDDREKAYYGSMLHFMRSVYRNRIREEGFEVRSLKKVPNNNTPSFGSNNNIEDAVNGIFGLKPDSCTNVLSMSTLPGDSIAYAISNTTAVLEFKDYLMIRYTKAEAPKEYKRSFHKGEGDMTSEIILVNGNPIEIEVNGSYFNPTDLLNLGYWSWSEKICNLLPFDYVPGKVNHQ
jgi:hypothetical protein